MLSSADVRMVLVATIQEMKTATHRELKMACDWAHSRAPDDALEMIRHGDVVIRVKRKAKQIILTKATTFQRQAILAAGTFS